jgi:gliding motility-associated-like protein
MRKFACSILIFFYSFLTIDAANNLNIPAVSKSPLLQLTSVATENHGDSNSVSSKELNGEKGDSLSRKGVTVARQTEPGGCTAKPIDDLYVNFNMSRSFLDIKHKELIGATPSRPDIISYKYDMGDGSPLIETTNTSINPGVYQHTYDIQNRPAVYFVKLTVENDEGCIKEATKTIEVIPFIPNVFTPNGDGINDLFMPDVALQILDRYGRVLYKGTEGWDGTYKGKILDRDTYFYLIDFIGIDNTVITHKGYVTLEK